MNKQKIYAFTLVELIVVITILAVLATVAFISFQGYSQNSRDVKRTTDIKIIEKGLSLFFTNNNYYPIPDSQSNISLSWTLVSIQWEAANWLLWTLKISQNTADPSTKKRYFYAINSQKNKFTISSKLENSLWYFNKAFASNEIFYTRWWNVWIILDSNWEILSSDLEINTVNTSDYKILFTNGILENVNREKLSNNAINNNKTTTAYHQNLIGYWDMQSITADGKLADLSGNENHWDGKWVIFWTHNWISWKSTHLDGYQCIQLDNIIDFRDTNNFTFSMFVNNIDPIHSTWYFFYNGQFFIRTRPEIENWNRNYEAFLNSPSWPEPRLLTNKSTLNVTKWDHLVITWDWEIFKYYINWILSNKIVRNIDLTPASYTSIWCVINSSEQNVWGLSADIDEVKIFNTALSDIEIYNIFEAK